MFTYDNVHEFYLKALFQVYYNYDYKCAPRDQQIKEKLNFMAEITHPTSEAIVTKDPDRNKIIVDYTQREKDWYLSGSRDVEDAMEISKFWGKIANPDGTINSNYGDLIFHDESEGDTTFSPKMRVPWEFAKNALLTDKDTRQAIVRFNKPRHSYVGNKDFVCTMYGNFHIRNDKLIFSVRMRSSDMFFGIVYDIPFFILLQEKMLAELKCTYPTLTIGHFNFMTDSLHIYERNFTAIKKMIGKG